MAKRVIQLYDKYKSTTKVYPLIVGECLTDDAKLAIKGIADKEIEDNVPDVIANVTLAGTEAELTSLQIGDTKYKVGGGKQLYQHNLCFYLLDTGNVDAYLVYLKIISDSSNPMDKTSIYNWLIDNGFKESESNIVIKVGWHKAYCVNGIPSTSTSSGRIFAIIASTTNENKIFAISNNVASSSDLSNANIQVNDIVIAL